MKKLIYITIGILVATVMFLMLTNLGQVLLIESGIIDPIKVISKYNGKSEKEMVEILGQPDSSETIPLSQSHDEMRFAIQEYFPVSQRNNPDVFVKEMWWKDGNYILTSWLKSTNDSWIVIESLKWHRDILF